jgi:hypothetical protein
MRVILIIALFFLQIFATNGQADKRQTITIEEALKISLQNNPVSLSVADRKKLSFDIKSAWYRWLFNIHKWQTLQDYEYLLSDLDRIAAERYQAGDFDLLEKSASLTKLAEIQTATAIVANEIDLTTNLLKQLLFTDTEIVPADTSLSIYQVVKGFGDEQYLSYQPEPNVQGDTLSSRYRHFIAVKSFEYKQLELDGCFIRLQFYNSFGLTHANTILQTSRAKFNAEEIDYLEFTEDIAEAFKIKLEYLETMNNYNQKAIQLEYYAY